MAHIYDTHTAWRLENAKWRFEHDDAELAVIRPDDRSLIRNTARDPHATYPLTVLDAEISRSDAACIMCNGALHGSTGATGLIFSPVDRDLAHLAEAYLLCPVCAECRDDDDLIVLLGGAA